MTDISHIITPEQALHSAQLIVHWRSRGVIATHFWSLSYRMLDRPDIAEAADRRAESILGEPQPEASSALRNGGDYLVRLGSTKDAPLLKKATTAAGTLHRVDSACVSWVLDRFCPDWSDPDDESIPEVMVPCDASCIFGSDSIMATPLPTPLQPCSVGAPIGLAPKIDGVLALFVEAMGLAMWLAPAEDERMGLLSFNDHVVGAIMPLRCDA